MATTTAERAQTMAAIERVTGQLVALVRGADGSVRVPATPDWTVAQAFAHVVTVAPRYARAAVHEGEWTETAGDLPELNARELTELDSLDLDALAEDLEATIASLGSLIESFGDEQPVFRFHGGATVAADVSLGILLGELVVHGHDIAEALHRRWPIVPADVGRIERGLDPILPGWLNPARAPGHTGSYEVRLRGGLGVHRFRFTDGLLETNPSGPFRPDVVISADPVTFLLVVYKRRSQWPGILTGKLVAWGRKPWRAFGFAGLFHRP